MFLLWGAFFVEHMQEWFSNPRQLPPPKVFAIVGLHLAMLLGLLAGWRWEVAGGLVTIVFAAAFFYFAAGRGFVPFTAITAMPGFLWLLCAALSALRGGTVKPAALL